MKKRLAALALVALLCLSMTVPAMAYDGGKTGAYNVVSAGWEHTAAIDEKGVLWVWGENDMGQMGNGGGGNDIGRMSHPIQTVPIQVMDNVVSVSCGAGNVAAIDQEGGLWMWGFCYAGKLGNGGAHNGENEYGAPAQTIPVKVMDGVAAVSCGLNHVAAIDKKGDLWMWGSNFDGQLGNNYVGDAFNESGSPYMTVPDLVMHNVVAVSCGGNHTAAIDADGTLWAWGSNEEGQLGTDGASDTWSAYYESIQTNPDRVMDHVVAVSCGENHTAAIDQDGTLWTWGWNEFGQLGTGDTVSSAIPVKVMDNAVSVSCGYHCTAVIDQEGALWIWGDDRHGQIGVDGQVNDENAAREPIQTLPTKVMDQVSAVSFGFDHTAAVTEDGTLWTWGANDCGQLGDGTTNSSPAPVPLSHPVMAKAGPSTSRRGTSPILILLRVVLAVLVVIAGVTVFSKKKRDSKQQ